jgi:hypothetical protein
VHASGLQELHCKVAIRQDGISPICLDGVALADIEVRALEYYAAASPGSAGSSWRGSADRSQSISERLGSRPRGARPIVNDDDHN